jgi:hypothetical protein
MILKKSAKGALKPGEKGSSLTKTDRDIVKKLFFSFPSQLWIYLGEF